MYPSKKYIFETIRLVSYSFQMLDHLVNVDLGQADDDLEGSEEELEVASREWKRMEERSLKEGFRS